MRTHPVLLLENFRCYESFSLKLISGFHQVTLIFDMLHELFFFSFPHSKICCLFIPSVFCLLVWTYNNFLKSYEPVYYILLLSITLLVEIKSDIYCYL